MAFSKLFSFKSLTKEQCKNFAFERQKGVLRGLKPFPKFNGTMDGCQHAFSCMSTAPILCVGGIDIRIFFCNFLQILPQCFPFPQCLGKIWRIFGFFFRFFSSISARKPTLKNSTSWTRFHLSSKILAIFCWFWLSYPRNLIFPESACSHQ